MANVTGEREGRLIQVAMLDIKDFEINRRVYSVRGISPTIRASRADGHAPAILVNGGNE